MRSGTSLVLLALAGCITPPPTHGSRTVPESPGDLYPFLWAQAAQWDRAMEQSPEKVAEISARIRDIANRYVDVLMRDLQLGRETENRIIAAFALGFCETKRSSLLPVLIGAMTADGSPEVRKNAAWSVGRLQPDPVPVEAYRALLGDSHANPRLGALAGLQFLVGPGRDLGLLADIHGRLFDVEPLVRAEAAALLGKIQKPESIPPLVQMLQREPTPRAAYLAVVSLGLIGPAAPEDLRATAIEALIDGLRSGQPDIVDAAHWGLRAITGLNLDPRWQTWSNWWREQQLRQGTENPPAPAPGR
jgi:hypothetical protein